MASNIPRPKPSKNRTCHLLKTKDLEYQQYLNKKVNHVKERIRRKSWNGYDVVKLKNTRRMFSFGQLNVHFKFDNIKDLLPKTPEPKGLVHIITKIPGQNIFKPIAQKAQSIIPISPINSLSTLSAQTSSLICKNQINDLNRLPCSTSVIDLLILISRYKISCEKLIKLILPINTLKLNENLKLIQPNLNCLNIIYQVI